MKLHHCIFTMFFFTMFFSATLCFPNGDSGYWGKGLILPQKVQNIFSLNGQGLLSPNDTINLYDSAGNRVGAFWKDGWIKNREKPKIAFKQLKYELFAIVVFQKNDNFLKIGIPESFFYIRESELDRVGYKYFNYMQYLIGLDYCPNILPHEGINVRDEPSINGKKILIIRKDEHVVKLTGKISNEYWAEVIIYEWPDAGCGGKKTGRQWKGWIKAVDNSGAPNIWTYISC